MKTYTSVIVVVLALFVSTQAELLTLTNDNFHHTTTQNPLVLVMWHADWCNTNCDNLRSAMQEADAALSKLNPPVKVAQMDIEQTSDDLKDKYGIRGAPNLKLFRNGEAEMFRGLRDTEGIVHYLTLLNGPAVTDVSTMEEYNALANNERMLHLVLGFFDKKEGAEYDLFAGLAEELRRDFSFVAISSGADEALYSKFGVPKTGNSLTYYKSWDKADHPKFTGAWENKTVTRFIREHSHPRLAVFGTTWAKYLNGHDLPIVHFILPFDDPLGADAQSKNPKDYEIAEAITQVLDFKDKVTFCLSPMSRKRGQIDNMGYKDARKLIMASKWGSKDRYIYEEQTWTFDGLGRWITRYYKGRVYPWVKSAPVPIQDPSSYVVEVVGKTFREIVLTPEKDVLIEFYAPWCGHCKRLIPEYERLAKRFRKVPTVTIAKIDATANDWPEKEKLKVTGYPTIYFVKGGSSNIGVSKFKYKRDYATMKKYIKQFAGIPFKFPKSKKKLKREEEAAKKAETAK